MTIEAVKCTIHSGGAAHTPGKPFEVETKRGEYLIAAGLAKAAGKGSPVTPPPAPPANEKPKEAKK
jgi:hypothetical protein